MNITLNNEINGHYTFDQRLNESDVKKVKRSVGSRRAPESLGGGPASSPKLRLGRCRSPRNLLPGDGPVIGEFCVGFSVPRDLKYVPRRRLSATSLANSLQVFRTSRREERQRLSILPIAPGARSKYSVYRRQRPGH